MTYIGKQGVPRNDGLDLITAKPNGYYENRTLQHHFHGDLNAFAEEVHLANHNWWRDPVTGEPIERNVGEMLMLCVSELAEAMEAHRKDLMDDHLPHRWGFEVEIVDCLIRLFDLGCGLGLDLDGAFAEKMEYNANRADHKPENRIKEGGKKY